MMKYKQFYKDFLVEGGSKIIEPNAGITDDMHGKRWTIDAYDNESTKGATPEIDEIKVLDIIQEIAHSRNVGFAEVFEFFRKATDEEKKRFDELTNQNKIREAWELVQQVVGVKLRGFTR